jgi:hypothetical protein
LFSFFSFCNTIGQLQPDSLPVHGNGLAESSYSLTLMMSMVYPATFHHQKETLLTTLQVKAIITVE